ncbi:hypothetical protein [Paraburkholderia graminis]|uniref:hypothetical protein n=1 Tax=Paraburkholderia graminis TaxID=60548 RepID=UPI0038B9D499
MNLNKLNSLVSRVPVVISILAAVISCWGAYTTNRNAKLTYRPYVTALPFLDQSGHRLGLYISNPGLGPAVLKDMTITMNGKSYSGLGRSKWPQFISDAGMAADCFREGWPPVGTVLKAGDDDAVLVLNDPVRLNCVEEMTKLLGGDDIHVHIEYDSIYDDRYSFDGSVHINDDYAEQAAATYRQLDSLRVKLGKLQSEINALANDSAATPTRQ